jgi:hypothetical protein
MFVCLQDIELEVCIFKVRSLHDNSPTTSLLPVQIRQTLLLHIKYQIDEQRI